VTRIFCSTCGSAIAHKSVFMGDAMAIQTGNLSDFSNVEFAFERESSLNFILQTLNSSGKSS
jgi:hypothetical protein